ncbi:DUF1850 domain-containing protein [Sedimentimonas flavescens]|uniref:DUF1850 domain-containing protein n=1 Tax=Sedimentimonas flavescens TaxID=2851012 RepID=UPI0021A3A0D7|nr:DUF1850 domain-containing protein [Sedimentimonas flavescens]MCT2539538.1 DUF1850 domain-containing protein [Sedimentimonas flavescens]WBL32793.1 DUF1850 domain-containing protein [Sinirhodobacter sp. HNIBRBA609]
MSGCLIAGAMTIALAAGGEFSLEWTHSVEKESWRERWRVEDGRMRLIEAAVKGSGAGMEPGPDGVFEDGWWVWQPSAPPVRELVLAASGKTPTGWQLCGVDCVTLGATEAEPLVLRPCAP